MITGCIRRRTVHTNIFETNGSFPLFLFQKGKIEEDAKDYYSYELKKHTKMKLFFLFVCLFLRFFFFFRQNYVHDTRERRDERKNVFKINLCFFVLF